MEERGKAALQYLQRGWIPIPLCWPDEKGNCACGRGHTGKNVGKAPLVDKWNEVRRPSREQVKQWWTEYPHANIGILLEPSHLAVIDPDSEEAIHEVQRLGLSPGPVSVTGKGFHYYFNSSGLRGRAVKRGQSKAIDILATGYVVAPPSLHQNGNKYKWKVPPQGELAPLPRWAALLLGGAPLREEDRLRAVEEKTPQPRSFEEIIARYRDRIPRKVLRVLLADEAEEGKRSDKLWWMDHELKKVGLSPQEIFTLVKNSVWNKYKGRKDEEIRLRREIAGAIEDEVVNQPGVESAELVIENFQQLMSNLKAYPGWLVEGFWTRRSHGFVAGEPKTFKSTLVLDLAVSLAAGKPFLNRFPVIEQGPVLIVQNENAPWIMKDRLEKITASKDLVGEVNVDEEGEIITVSFPPSLPLYFINQQGFNLSDPAYQATLAGIVRNAKPILVVLDPLYLMFSGDVNSAKDLNPILNWLLKLKEDYETGLLLIHHMSKGSKDKRGGQRMLGSTTLHGWAESALYISLNSEEAGSGEGDSDLTKPGEPSIITIEREFRGAGTYPKVDVSLKMGEFGDPLYEVIVTSHREKGKKIPNEQLYNDIIAVLETTTEPMTAHSISKAIGLSRSKTLKLINDLARAERVMVRGRIVELVR